MLTRTNSFIKYTLIFICSLICVSLSTTSVHAAGEKYGWEDKNKDTIQVSGGDYSVGFILSKAGSKFTDAGIVARDKVSGCPIFVTATVNPAGTKATIKVELDAVTAITDGSCNTSLASNISTRFDKTANIDQSNTDRDSINNTSVKVQAVTEGGDFPAKKDTITIKKSNGKQAAKKATSTKTDGGLVVTFPNIPYGQYSACSKALDLCQDFRHQANGPLLATTVTISKDLTAEDSSTSCAVDGIGWIVCPVVTFLAKLNDAAFGFLNNFLNVPPDIFNDDATRAAWEAFRNIANIAFVIAFLIIIYSQMTGAGITNYGLKKLMPKLIIAAILVNVSYFICQIAVDLSNILGASIYDLIKGINIGEDTGAGGAASTVWSTAGAVVLGAGAAVGLLALIIFAPMSLIAFALIIMILIARQAFVVLLIVISPLAFVAYLLPNTENWFKKWWKALVTVLMVFPIIALVFGASSLASDILLRVSQDGAGGGDDNQLLKIVAAGVLAMPLFAVPVLLKGALSAAGSVGAKVGGLQDKANRFGGRSIKNSRLGEAKGAFDARRQHRKLKRRVGDGRLGRINQAIDRSKFGRVIGGDRGAAAATSAVHHEFDEEVKRQKTLLSGRSNDSLVKDLREGNGSEEYQAAVAGTLMSRNHRTSHLEALEAIRSRSQQAEANGDHKGMEVTSSIQKQMASDMKDKPWALGDQAAGQLVEGTYGRSKSEAGETHATHFTNTIEEQLKDRVGTKLSAQSLATMNPDEMKLIYKSATDGSLGEKELTQLKSAISDVRSNPQMNALVKPEAREQFDAILPPTPPASAQQSDYRGDGSGYL